MTENESRLTKRNSDGSVGINEFRYYNHNDVQKLTRKLADYEDVGTIEEFKALKEKNVAKKVNRKPNYDMTHEEITCPICGKYISEYTSRNYCDCGQKLDWQ